VTFDAGDDVEYAEAEHLPVSRREHDEGEEDLNVEGDDENDDQIPPFTHQDNKRVESDSSDESDEDEDEDELDFINNLDEMYEGFEYELDEGSDGGHHDVDFDFEEFEEVSADLKSPIEDKDWFDPNTFFTTENNWSTNSIRYFKAEHRDGTGREAIVKNVFFNKKSRAQISKEVMFSIFHEAATYYNVTHNDRGNFCSMVNSIRSESDLREQNNNDNWEDALRASLSDLKIEWTETYQIEDFVEKVKRRRNKQTAEREFHSNHLQPIRQMNDVRSKFVGGPKSLVNQLPIPDVDLKKVEDPLLGERHFAHIDVDQLVNHALAYKNNNIHYYRAGYEEDWNPELYSNDPVRQMFMMSDYFREIKERVKILNRDGVISNEARIVFMRSWSDAFGAHAITANNEFNSIQVFTVRIKGEEDVILPHALLFKKLNTRHMALEQLREIMELEKPKHRYWSKEKNAIETLLFNEICSNDLPERCYNLSYSLNGTYSKWFGHSCLFDPDITPSCHKCFGDRVRMVIEGSCDQEQLPRRCSNCKDWWSNVTRADTRYPLPPSFDILNLKKENVPAVSLTLSAIRNSLQDLADWYSTVQEEGDQSNIKKAKKVVHSYVRLLCLAGPDEMEAMVLKHYDDLSESNEYPPILQQFEELGIEMSLFPSVVMHMFFLGVAKRLIKESNRLKVKDSRTTQVKLWWKSFITLVQTQQKVVKGLSLSWCYPMSFSANGGDDDEDDLEDQTKGKKKKRGFQTMGWTSSHYVDFTRISLFQYSKLDRHLCTAPEGFEAVLPAFNRLMVVWFCLVSNAFGNTEHGNSLRIDHLVRLFLSCCVSFHKVAKKTKAKKSFYESTSNFFSLLNCKKLIDVFGSLRYLWEGLDERFIQLLKREIKTLRHNTRSLKNLLEKMLITKVLNELNRDNPHRHNNDQIRTSAFKTYYKGAEFENAEDVLEKCQFISGVVINNEFYISFRVSERAHQLHKLKFLDGEGKWILNLWYSKIEIEGPCHEFSSKAEIQGTSDDQFLLLRQSEDDVDGVEGLGTIICHSWRVRVDDGRLELPMPREEIFQ
jgi:hypothetical protein